MDFLRIVLVDEIHNEGILTVLLVSFSVLNLWGSSRQAHLKGADWPACCTPPLQASCRRGGVCQAHVVVRQQKYIVMILSKTNSSSSFILQQNAWIYKKKFFLKITKKQIDAIWRWTELSEPFTASSRGFPSGRSRRGLSPAVLATTAAVRPLPEYPSLWWLWYPPSWSP